MAVTASTQCAWGYGKKHEEMEEEKMKLSVPSKIVWIAALVNAVMALVGNFFSVPVLSPLAFYFMLIAYVMLVLGTLIKKM